MKDSGKSIPMINFKFYACRINKIPAVYAMRLWEISWPMKHPMVSHEFKFITISCHFSWLRHKHFKAYFSGSAVCIELTSKHGWELADHRKIVCVGKMVGELSSSAGSNLSS